MATEQPSAKKTEPQWNAIFKCDAITAWEAYRFLMADLGYTEQTVRLKSPTFIRFLERCFPGFSLKPKKEKPAKQTKTEKKESKKSTKK